MKPQSWFRGANSGYGWEMAKINNPFDEDEVVGVAPAGARDEIVSALTNSGFEIEVLQGPTDASEIDVEGDSIASKINRFFQQGEELDALKKFQGRLMAGDDVIRILGVGDRAEEAGTVFGDHGGETIWHYGKWTYKKLYSGETETT